MNYNKKRFKPIQISSNSQVDENMVFEYNQQGKVLECDYQSGNIVAGHLLGIVDEQGRIEMRYHQINRSGEISTGICFSEPLVLENGKIRLFETWKWTSGDETDGVSVLEEI